MHERGALIAKGARMSAPTGKGKRPKSWSVG